MVFETAPLDEPIEILGAPIVTLDVASDRPIANLVVRLCDVHPSGESLRVSYGVLNLTHREGHEQPALLATGERYSVRIQLNDAGSVFPAGHKARLAISTAYWPMIWPSPETATVQIIAGTLDLPRRSPNLADAKLLPFPNRRRRHPRSQPSFIAMAYGSSASTASVWNWVHSGIRSITSRRMIRSAPLPSCGILNSVAKRMANPNRDADAAIVHRRCFLAARKLARLRGRERSVPAQLKSLLFRGNLN